MIRSTVSLSLCALAVGGSVSADGCWRTEEDKYMICNPSDPNGQPMTGTGTKSSMQQRCIDLGIDCMGITCTKEGKCSLRHPFHCEHEGDNIQPSTSGETTYVKQCELGKYNFISHPSADIICTESPDTYRGDRVEGEIRCAALGHQCFGLTCNTSSAFPDGYDCALKERRYCDDEKIVDVTGAEVPKISYVMKVKDESVTPEPNGCDFTRTVNKKFGCPTSEQTMLTLAEAKLECAQASTPTNSCLGVLCSAGSTTDCRLHYVCPEFNQAEFLVDSTEYEVHIKTCSDGPVCVSPCHVHVESANHRCGTDCHCTGSRICSNGYCSGDEQICLEGSCVFEEQPFKYLPCHADDNTVGSSLADAQDRCRELGDRCTGVTCKDGLCTTRFPALKCRPDGSENPGTSREETSYIKCCGTRDIQQLYCPGAFHSSSSSHAGLYIFFIILLLVIVAGLFYKNRQMANNFIAPDAFKAVPHNDAEEGGDWVVNDNMDERDDDIQ